MAKKADIPNRIIDAALRLAAERGWRELSLGEIAAAAELPLSKVYPVYSSKAADNPPLLRDRLSAKSGTMRPAGLWPADVWPPTPPLRCPVRRPRL